MLARVLIRLWFMLTLRPARIFVSVIVLVAVAAVGCSTKTGWRPKVKIVLGREDATATEKRTGEPPDPVDVALYNGEEDDCAGPPDGLTVSVDGAPLRLVSPGGLTHDWKLGPNHVPKRFALCTPSFFRLDEGVRDRLRATTTVLVSSPSGILSCEIEGAFDAHAVRLVAPAQPRVRVGDTVTVALSLLSDARHSRPVTTDPIVVTSQPAQEGRLPHDCVASVGGAKLGVGESKSEYTFTMPAMCPGRAVIGYTGASTPKVTRSEGAACAVAGHRNRDAEIEIVP